MENISSPAPDSVTVSTTDRLRRYLPYVLPVVLLWALVVVFLFLQYSSEKEHKTKELDLQLQLLNRSLLADIAKGESIESALQQCTTYADAVRITLIGRNGRVLFDNREDASKMENHLNREEVAEALKHGSGHTINRLSETNQIPYFYSATRSGDYILRSALPYSVSLQNILKANSTTWWLVAMLTVFIMAVILVLIRTLKQRDSHYARCLEQEKEKIRIKRQLTNNINHELKTPVASIQVCLETLINARLSEEQKAQMIDRCYQSCQRLRNLLRDVSLITRMEEGNSHIGKEPVNLNEIVNDLKDELAVYPPEKRLAVDIQFPEQVTIMGNASLLISIFRNLTENAIAYSEGSQIRITLQENNGEECRIAFEDNGVGVEPQHLSHLFERFYRVDKGRSRQTGGTGLGLAIVKHAVLFHGGDIAVENKKEGGLRFVFSLKKK